MLYKNSPCYFYDIPVVGVGINYPHFADEKPDAQRIKRFT